MLHIGGLTIVFSSLLMKRAEDVPWKQEHLMEDACELVTVLEAADVGYFLDGADSGREQLYYPSILVRSRAMYSFT